MIDSYIIFIFLFISVIFPWISQEKEWIIKQSFNIALMWIYETEKT